MTYDAHQLDALHSLIDWLSTMDSHSLVDVVDRLHEATTDEAFIAVIDEVEANEDP
jgi:mannitol/fructose-specific phosphotransferase system IIA component (Ntr-type)